jgi:hypothetical protein
MPANERPVTQEGHEGATESTAPGRPNTREVITPDWAVLDKGDADCVPGETPTSRARTPGKPAIDRHR